MCTLAIAWNVFDEAPIAVAANRDEALDRSAKPPGVYRRDPLIIAPRDNHAGGTWIGCTESGLVTGISNRWTDADLDGDRSRGQLVADVLETGSVVDATTLVETETARVAYDAFNLVVADEDHARCFIWDGNLERIDFDPGVHVVVNVAVDDVITVPNHRKEQAHAQVHHARTVRSELQLNPDEDVNSWLERAKSILGDHEFGVCIHGDGFGTRSSSIIATWKSSPPTDDGIELPACSGSTRVLTYEFANGPPCQTPFLPIDVEGHI